jgi:SOS response regulatory protein OraA/RecX
MTQAEYAKQGRFLASRGFSMDVIQRVLKQTRSLGESVEDQNAEVENAGVQMSKVRGKSDPK